MIINYSKFLKETKLKKFILSFFLQKKTQKFKESFPSFFPSVLPSIPSFHPFRSFPLSFRSFLFSFGVFPYLILSDIS